MPAGSTYTPIATTTLSSAQNSITIGSGGTIPQTYTDLVLVISGSTASSANPSLRFNSDSGNNYSETYLLNAGSSRDPNVSYAFLGTISNTQSTTIMNIQNYSNSNTNKTVISRSNEGATNVSAWVALWRNTGAITSIQVGTGGAVNYNSGTTFTLYGIAAA